MLHLKLKQKSMSEITKRVGELIRKVRKEKGFTQKELGEKLGLTEATFNRYETGRQNLTLDTLQKIADVLEVRVNILFE